MKLKLKKGDCIEKMGELEESSVSSILCDPPYGLEFIAELDGKHRDLMRGTTKADIERKERYGNNYSGRASNLPHYNASFSQYRYEVQEWHKGWVGACQRVLSEEGVLMAFNSSKTSHRMIAAMVELGFYISIDSWVYLSGMPKARDLGAGEGWYTHLKPSYEPVIVCRKQKG